MNIVEKIGHRIDKWYKQKIVYEQYPMLTSMSRRMLRCEGALGVIYMLHHVAAKDSTRIPTNEDLKVSPEFLDKLITKYKSQHVDFISLDELYRRICSGNNSSKPFVAFTFDDGYLDNYTQALPVFEKHQIPFAIFVATDFIDKKAILWWDSIEEQILTHDKIETSNGKCYPCGTFQQRWDAFRFLRKQILNLNQENLHSELQHLFDHYEIDWLAPIKEKGMSWEQVKKLSAHPLCTIGGHTVSHPALNKLPAEKAMHEIVEGLRRIEEVTQKRVHFFAYPYGTPNEIGDRECQIIKDCDIKLAFMAHQGCLANDNQNNLSHLPRVYLHETTFLK
jgi:peptidoglycan/xylan/chitin deacetylase (PgdA/CDA1 family)